MTYRAAQTERLSDIVLPAYQGEFWHTTKTYVVCKGSRGSGKSKQAALWHIWYLRTHPLANALVVRKVFRTLKDSCYADLRWAIHRLHMDSEWACTTNPLEITRKETGQKILFRGLDDPLKVTSVAVATGVLNLLWVEEAYEVTHEEDFDMLDESIRGLLPDGYHKRVTVTFNPWSDRHFAKKRFFDTPQDNVLAMTTTYQDNAKYLSATDLQLFEQMRINNPRRYRVAGLGEWGITEGLVYEKWREERFALDDIRKVPGIKSVFGLDFGYTNDPSALFVGFIDLTGQRLWVWDEMYKTGMSNRRIAEEVKAMGYGKERIVADSAEPKSIDELKAFGLRVKGAAKGKDSVQNGIQFIQDFDIIVHPRCTNFLTEISNYCWEKDRFGNWLNKPIDDFNHLMDAMRYGCEQYISSKGWMY